MARMRCRDANLSPAPASRRARVNDAGVQRHARRWRACLAAHPGGRGPGRAAAAASEPVLDTEAQQLDVLELDAVVALVPVVVPVGEGVGGVDQVEVEVAGEIGANAHAEIGAVGIGLVRAGLDVAVEVAAAGDRSEEHTSELQSRENLVCRLLLEK